MQEYFKSFHYCGEDHRNMENFLPAMKISKVGSNSYILYDFSEKIDAWESAVVMFKSSSI